MEAPLSNRGVCHFSQGGTRKPRARPPAKVSSASNTGNAWSERERGREREKGGGEREQVDGPGEGAEGRRARSRHSASARRERGAPGEVPQVKASKVKDGCMTGGDSWYLPIEVAEGT